MEAALLDERFGMYVALFKVVFEMALGTVSSAMKMTLIYKLKP